MALDTIDSAHIDFGLDTDYGQVAPVELSEASHSTLLLGMKPSSTYHFRVSVMSDGILFRSDDYTVDTDEVLNGLPEISIDTKVASALAGDVAEILAGSKQTASPSGQPSESEIVHSPTQ